MRHVYFFFILFLVGCGSNDVKLQDKENLENELISRIKAKENEVQKSFEANNETRISRKNKNSKKRKLEKLKLEKRKENSKVIINDMSQGDVGGDRKKVDSKGDVGQETPKSSAGEKKNDYREEPFYLSGVKDKFRKSFNVKYNVSLLGVVMGQLDRFSQKINSNELILGGKLKNRSLYKYLYSIDDSLITKADWGSLSPVVVNLEKNENGASAVSVQRYFGEKVVFFENVLKNGKKSSKERVVNFKDHYFDPLLFLRLIEVIDIELLKEVMVPIIFRGKLYYMKTKIVSEVEKKLNGRKVRLQRITFDTYRNGKIKKVQKITLEKIIGNEGKIFSMEGRMKVGVLYGELVEQR